MKKLSCITIVCALALVLSGCALFPSRPRGEELAVVQAMGLDGAGGELRLSLVTAADSSRGEGPVRMRGTGATIPAAAARIDGRAAEEELFLAHTAALLLGEESARKDVESALRYVCRSREIRMDVPLLIVRGASAETALLETGDERVGAAELLGALAASAPTRDGEPLPSVGLIAGRLAEGKCALAAALACVPSSEGAEGESPLTLSPAGYAVLRNGALAAFIEPEEAAAVDLLRGAKGVHDFVVSDPDGRLVTLQTAPGSAETRLVRGEDGAPEAIELTLRVPASVVAVDGAGELSDEAYADALAAALEREILRRALSVLQLERSLGAEFLPLRGIAGLRGAAAELPVRLSVSVRISHTGDMRDG